ncbi:MAG: OmpH family outer membrane protein [Oligoflexia bacterium]|nr:OmpH family outer membrane protein [Oligoflexia bacterium]
MRTLRVAVAVLALSATPLALPSLSAPAHAEVTVAIVDFQEAINQVKDGATAKGRLEGIFAEKKKSIDAMEQQLKTLQDDYQKQAMVLSDAARAEKEQQIMQLQNQYQQTYAQSQQDMQEEYSKTMDGLISKMQVIVQAIGKERGYTVVLEKTEGGVVWSQDSIDVTAELVKRYDAQNGG